MQPPPIARLEIETRIGPHLDELLELWWAEQGDAKSEDLELIASALPFPRRQELRVLDLGCGPGDVGRAIWRHFPNAVIDGVDRDPFLAPIAIAVNRRDRVPGRIIVWDLNDHRWVSDFKGDYDVVATVNALHWFDPDEAGAVLNGVHGLLGRRGVLMFAEPVAVEARFAEGFAAWKAKQPARYSQERWRQFWSRASAILGYDHTKLLGAPGAKRIGDRFTVANWIELGAEAGFSSDVLLRDADQVLIGGTKTP